MRTKVTINEIKELLAKSEVEVKTVFEKVTVVTCKLPNGFVIVESSGAVDKANYDVEIGKAACLERIENKLWELEGYALARERYENNELFKKLSQRNKELTKRLEKKGVIKKPHSEGVTGDKVRYGGLGHREMERLREKRKNAKPYNVEEVKKVQKSILEGVLKRHTDITLE
ncbi:hypothetical protein RyT2_11670 [Pseudolactococcus yaeyamensis]